MVLLRRYADHMTAEFDRAVLETHGIPSLIVTDDAGGMIPLPSLGVIRLMVPEEDVDRAIAALGLSKEEEAGAP